MTRRTVGDRAQQVAAAVIVAVLIAAYGAAMVAIVHLVVQGAKEALGR